MKILATFSALLIAFSLNSADTAYRDQHQLNLLVLNNFREIVENYHQKQQNLEKNTNLLNTGYWALDDYFRILKEKKQIKRLNFFIDRDVFFNGWADSKFFTPENKTNLNYLLANGMSPAQAVRDFGQYFILIDCAIALQVACYKALLQIWGESKFNQILNQTPGYFLAYKTEQSKISSFIKTTPMTENLDLVGKYYYMANNRSYCLKHYRADGMGFNLLVIGHQNANGEPLFIGFGLDPQGVTRNQLKTYFIDKFNSTPCFQQFCKKETIEKELKAYDPLFRKRLDILQSTTINKFDDDLFPFMRQELLAHYLPIFVDAFLEKTKIQLAERFSYSNFFLDYEKIIQQNF